MSDHKTEAAAGSGYAGPACSDLYSPPQVNNPIEWILHPIGCVIMFPLFLAGGIVAGAYEGTRRWFWNCINSSSLRGCWRPSPNPTGQTRPTDGGK